MSTEAANAGQADASGTLTLDEAADVFHTMLMPEEKGKSAEEDTKAAIEGDDDPDDADEPSTSQDDEEGETQEEGSEDEEESAPELHTVKVNGEEQRVSLEDLKAGYQRNEDYTRKTMALAEQRKAAEADHSAVRAEREHYAAMLGQLQQQIRQAEPQIDWEQLKLTDPQQWMVMKVEQQDRERAMAGLQAEQERVNAQMEQTRAQQQNEVLRAEETKLLEAIPEWKDPEKAKAGKAALLKAGQSYGYSTKELAGVTDSRAVVILKKAVAYDELMAKKANLKPDSREPSTRPARPGATPQKVNGVVKASQRLAKSGSVEDAADYFFHATKGG
jgi:hypothetical protein